MDCNFALHYADDSPCTASAAYVIIWGCLDQHIMEFVACPKHMHEWIRSHQTNQIICAYCYNSSADYITNHLRNIYHKALRI